MAAPVNDNLPQQALCEIRMLDGEERLTVIHSRDIAVGLIEFAAKLLRANQDLAYIEMCDLNGGTITAYRGERPEGFGER